MDNKYKVIAARAAREGKTKLELMMQFPKANSSETKEIYLFYQLSKEIINLVNAGESDSVLKAVIVRTGFSVNDLDLIKGKNELKSILSGMGTTFVSLVFVLLFVFVLGILLWNIFGGWDLDFNQKESIQIHGSISGGNGDFFDILITSTNASIKSVKRSDNNYSLVVACDKDFTLNFSKKGFVPLHKKVNFCVSQELDIIMAPMSVFEKIDLNSKNIVSNNGVKVELDGNDLVIKGTNNSPKNAELSVTGFNSASLEDMKYFPGETKGLDENNNKKSIVVYGFAKILLQNQSHQNIDFKTENAKITFPIATAQINSAPQEVILWNFNETSGNWVYANDANKVCNQTNCYYEAKLKKIGSWYCVGEAVDPTTTLFVNGFDYSAPNNRVDSASVPFQRPTTGTPIVNPGEKVVDLPSIKTNMVCEYDRLTKKTRIENYDTKSLAEVIVDEEAGFMLWTTTKTDYFGKGVAQVIQDEKGNTIRELETQCVCKETKTFTNRNIIDCDGFYEGVRYDNCETGSVAFSCTKINCANPCQDFETFKSCNPDFSKYFDAVKKFSDQFEKDNGRKPTALEFFRTIMKENYPIIDESVGSEIAYSGGSYTSEEEKRSLNAYSKYKSNFPNTQDDGEKKLNINGVPYNTAHIAVAVSTRYVAGAFFSNVIQNTTDLIDSTSFSKGIPTGVQNFNANRVGQGLATKANRGLSIMDYFEKVFFPYMCTTERKHQETQESYKQLMSGLSAESKRFNQLQINNYNAKISNNLNNNSTGYFTLNLPEEKDISIKSGVNVTTGEIHFPINNFVYYSELPFFENKLTGGVVIYDWFVKKSGGDYLIGNNEGVYRISSESSIIVSENPLKIKIDNQTYEFSEKVEDLYFITNKKTIFSDGTIETSYSYESGLLEAIENSEVSVKINYEQNKLTKINYVFTDGTEFDEEFVYENDKLLKVSYTIGEETADILYSRTLNQFEVESDWSKQIFLLNLNKVEKVDSEIKFDNNVVRKILEFEYSQDYTFVTIDHNYTNTCFNGICFINELAVSQTTAQKCLDYYPLNSELKSFDEFDFVIQEKSSEGVESWTEYNINKSNIEKINKIELAQNSDVNFFLKLNGVLSNPVKIKVENEDSIDLDSLLNKPKNCNSSRVSFGGFLLNNCRFYQNDVNGLTKCVVGSVAMLNSPQADLVALLNELDINNQIQTQILNKLK